jgi:hypothetical protein
MGFQRRRLQSRDRSMDHSPVLEIRDHLIEKYNEHKDQVLNDDKKSRNEVSVIA